MDSFYGGPSGKSFEIEKIFRNKKEMANDLSKRWQSSIPVTGFVIISYGIPGIKDEEFVANQELDKAEYGQSYNATIWQKIYTENKSTEIDKLTGIEVLYAVGNYGLGYRLVASMSGNTPRFTFIMHIINANEKPRFSFDNTNIDRPVVNLWLPQSQVLHVNDIVILNADQKPVIIYDDSDINKPQLTFKIPQAQNLKVNDIVILDADQKPSTTYDETNINKPVLTIKIPQSQVFQQAILHTLNANQPPRATIDYTNINKPVPHFYLPVSQILQQAVTHDLKANEDPNVIIDASNINKPVPHFYLPVSQQLQAGTTTTIDCDLDPSFSINSSNPDRPVINFKLPRSQIINEVRVHELKANQSPRVEIDTITHSINDPILHFYLPNSQMLIEGTTTVLDADQMPDFTINYSDPDRPVLNFSLPRSQTMIEPITNTIDPGKNPEVSLGGTANHPQLTFDLPRAVKFYYGALLGGRAEINYTLTDSAVLSYKEGDYYINAATGFIYVVTKATGTQTSFQYVACLQAPIPEISTQWVNPYTSNGEQRVQPSITSSFTNNTEKTGWNLNFKLPKIPNFSVTHEFVGSAEEGGATITPDASDNVTLHLTLPQGNRMFAGEIVSGEGSFDVLDAIVGDALPGDLYLNTKTGSVYKLDTSGVWKFQNDGLRGPVGKALNIVRNYRITVTSTNPDTLSNGAAYIEENYKDESGHKIPLSPEEIFGVTWIDNENMTENAYWYFFTAEGKWGRVPLTGGIMNLIESTYVESTDLEPIVNKTYSIHYINSLIGGNFPVDNGDKTTFSKEQIYGLFAINNFSEVEGDAWWTKIQSTEKTLSTDEILELLTWGKFNELLLP